jgi:hypothetical protein
MGWAWKYRNRHTLGEVGFFGYATVAPQRTCGILSHWIGEAKKSAIDTPTV